MYSNYVLAPMCDVDTHQTADLKKIAAIEIALKYLPDHMEEEGDEEFEQYLDYDTVSECVHHMSAFIDTVCDAMNVYKYNHNNRLDWRYRCIDFAQAWMETNSEDDLLIPLYLEERIHPQSSRTVWASNCKLPLYQELDHRKWPLQDEYYTADRMYYIDYDTLLEKLIDKRDEARAPAEPQPRRAGLVIWNNK